MLVALLGYPLTGSRSPRMQNAAFAECGLDWSYALVPVHESHVEQAVAGLVELGFAGANVTTPHKLAVRAFCETDLPSAVQASGQGAPRLRCEAPRRAGAPRR